jgi:hypothetical protein
MADPTTFTPDQVTAALAALGIDPGDNLQSVCVTTSEIQINRTIADAAGTTTSSVYPVSA